MTPRFDESNGTRDPLVGLDIRALQIVQSAKDVVVPNGGKCKASPLRIDDVARGQSSQHPPLLEIVVRFAPGIRNGRRAAPRSFVFQ